MVVPEFVIAERPARAEHWARAAETQEQSGHDVVSVITFSSQLFKPCKQTWCLRIKLTEEAACLDSLCHKHMIDTWPHLLWAVTPCDDSRIQEHCQLSPSASVPGPGAGQCAGVLGHNGTIHLLECSWLSWGTRRAGGGWRPWGYKYWPWPPGSEWPNKI